MCEERENLQAIFDKYASDNKTLDKSEFVNVLRAEFPEADVSNKDEAEVLQQLANTDDNNTITFEEFASFVEEFCLGFSSDFPITDENDPKIKAIFNKYAGENQTLDKDQLIKLLRTECPEEDIQDKDDAQMLIDFVDEDGNCALSFEEFFNLVDQLCIEFK